MSQPRTSQLQLLKYSCCPSTLSYCSTFYPDSWAPLCETCWSSEKSIRGTCYKFSPPAPCTGSSGCVRQLLCFSQSTLPPTRAPFFEGGQVYKLLWALESLTCRKLTQTCLFTDCVLFVGFQMFSLLLFQGERSGTTPHSAMLLASLPNVLFINLVFST